MVVIRRLLTCALAVTCVFLLSTQAHAADAKAKKPNFVILFADDLGYGDLGCYGHPTIRTPNLDRMAAEGIRFTDFYSAAPVCSPSRAALLTGRLPVRSGSYGYKHRVIYADSRGGLPAYEITLAEALKGAGYATAIIGKWHLGGGPRPDTFPMAHGFDYWYGLPFSNDMKPHSLWRNDKVLEDPAQLDTLIERYTQEAVKYIDEHKGGPFLLYLAWNAPHVPIRPNAKFEGKSIRGKYGDVVEEIDWSAGEVFKALRGAGVAENTLVFFSSDNGPWLIKNQDGGSAGLLRDGKGSTFDGGMREPTMVWWPGTVKPGIAHGLCSLMDVFPTCLELAGVELPKDRDYDGRSIVKILHGEGQPGSDGLFFYWRDDRLMAVRKGLWKAHFFTRQAYGPEQNKLEAHDPPLLYNLGEDPSEKYDLAKAHPNIVAELKAAYQEHKANVTTAPAQYDP